MNDYDSNNKFTFDPLNADIDKQWAGRAYDHDTRFNNYYDYYYSGEDIKVYIDGLFGPEDELDLASFSYSVRQEKQPLYGFWSYNFDAVMAGTRLITGEFTMFTRHPRRMTDFLEKAAKIRATEKDSRNIRNSIVTKMWPQGTTTDDEKNIQKYWASSQLDRITWDPAVSGNGNHIFSAHPPFNLIIAFGVEETAITPMGSISSETYSIEDNLDRIIYSDVNQRSVKLENLVSPMKVVIQQVQLMNMTTGLSPGGQPVAESYQFMARDYYFTQADLSFIKTLETVNTSDSDVGRKPSSQDTQTGVGGGGGRQAT